MIFLIDNSALIVTPRFKTLPDPVVVVDSPPQCAIAPVVLPDPVQCAVVVVSSPPQWAIRPVVLPDPVRSAF